MEEEAPETGESEAQRRAASPAPASGSSPTNATAEFRLTGSKRGRAAASREAILGLREVVAAPTDGPDRCCCAICLQEFDAHVRLRAMPCSHAFHYKCISEWLRRSAACPLCRHQLPTEEEEEEEEEGRMGTHRWLNLVEEQEQRITLQSERLLRWINLVDELLQQRITSQSSSM